MKVMCEAMWGLRAPGVGTETEGKKQVGQKASKTASGNNRRGGNGREDKGSSKGQRVSPRSRNARRGTGKKSGTEVQRNSPRGKGLQRSSSLRKNASTKKSPGQNSTNPNSCSKGPRPLPDSVSPHIDLFLDYIMPQMISAFSVAETSALAMAQALGEITNWALYHLGFDPQEALYLPADQQPAYGGVGVGNIGNLASGITLGNLGPGDHSAEKWAESDASANFMGGRRLDPQFLRARELKRGVLQEGFQRLIKTLLEQGRAGKELFRG
jgi:hypothetical protein